jgi:hypothetical protein
MPVNGVGFEKTASVHLERVANSGDSGDFSGLLQGADTAQTDLDSVFAAASEKYGVPLNLLKAVAKVESSFRADATSRCGAMGIMQLTPRTAKSLGVNDAYNPVENIMGGAKYLGQLLNKYDGDTSLALAAYNAGPGTVAEHNGVPTFCQGYIDKVLRNSGSELSAGTAATQTSGSISPEAALAAASAGSDGDDRAQQLLMQIMIQQMILSKGWGGEQDEQSSMF